jgi:hypothetical protein
MLDGSTEPAGAPAERRSMTTHTDLAVEHRIRDGIARAVAVVGLAGVALIHVLDMPGTFQAAPYRGWLYVALVVGCLGTAATLVRRSDPRAWLAAGALPLGAMVAFVISRTVGLPNGADDIGNWSEPLGLASLFVEACVVALCARMLLETAGSAVPCFARAASRPLPS